MRLIHALPFALVAAALPALAQSDPSPAQMDLAKQLIATGNFPDQVLKAIGPQIKAGLAAAYNKAGKPADEKAIDDFVADFTKQMQPKLLAATQEATPEVAKVFSEDELKALVAFASTPAGKGALDKFPSYVAAIIQKVGPAMQAQAPEIIKSLKESYKAKGVQFPE
ncbi:MAG: DUF2059 domain-containing protein [Hyphomicrobiales bacterium]